MNPVFKIAIGAIFVFTTCFMMRAEAAETPKVDTIVVAGGCFWGVQSVFEHTKGVVSAVSGYAGGTAETAYYEAVSRGTTGHAESVYITYDPQQISLSQLLDIYFIIAHNPTQLNYQGPDHGTQYRSHIFMTSFTQQKEIEDKIAALDAKHIYARPIVTKLEKLHDFYRAEEYHQHYADLHPNDPYILANDAPKIAHLKSLYPSFYKE